MDAVMVDRLVLMLTLISSSFSLHSNVTYAQHKPRRTERVRFCAHCYAYVVRVCLCASENQPSEMKLGM